MTSKGCRSTIENIKVRHEKRKKIDSNLYSSFNLGNLYITQQKERHFLQLLDKFGMNPLSGKKIFEAGCGNDSWLRAFLNYGAEPENIHGVELIEQMVKNAKYISPNLNITEGNCEDLKFIRQQL